MLSQTDDETYTLVFSVSLPIKFKESHLSDEAGTLSKGPWRQHCFRRACLIISVFNVIDDVHV